VVVALSAMNSLRRTVLPRCCTLNRLRSVRDPTRTRDQGTPPGRQTDTPLGQL